MFTTSDPCELKVCSTKKPWNPTVPLALPAVPELSALYVSRVPAKRSCTAYQKPGPRKPGRGRPPKKGAAVYLKNLFGSHAGQYAPSHSPAAWSPSWSRMLKGMHAQLRMLPARMPSPPNICPWMNPGLAEFSDSWKGFFTPGIRCPSLDCFTPSPTRT